MEFSLFWFMVGVVLYLFVSNFIRKFRFYRTEVIKETKEKVISDNPLIYITDHVGKDGTTFLVYNAVTDGFVCQGSTVAEVQAGIERVFKNKEQVMLLIDENTIKPLYIKGIKQV